MTPKEAFESCGRNPKTGIWVRDWYSVISGFARANILYESKILTAPRQLIASDVASNYILHTDLVLRPPDTTKADDIIAFLQKVFDKYQCPRKGVAISHSVWYSSHEILMDEDTASRGEFLREIQTEFGPMTWDDKKRISDWILSFGIKCEFDPDEIN